MDNPEWMIIDDEYDAPEPYWTVRRILYTLVLVITLLAFLAYVLLPVFDAPYSVPNPPNNPFNRV